MHYVLVLLLTFYHYQFLYSATMITYNSPYYEYPQEDRTAMTNICFTEKRQTNYIIYLSLIKTNRRHTGENVLIKRLKMYI